MNADSATHGDWCNSRTYPTTCKYCGDRVFYFSCDHGCKVFFNDLGPPWPEHRCIPYLTAQYGREFVERGLAIMMMTPGVEVGRKIDHAYTAKVQKQRPALPQIVRCDPPHQRSATDDEGLIREIIPRVDIYKHFKIPGTTVGAGLLGPLAREPYAQITVHTESLGNEDNFSYTFFVKQSMVDEMGLSRDDFVVFRVQALAIPGRNLCWICDSLMGPLE
jgi:hypothetical protein